MSVEKYKEFERVMNFYLQEIFWILMVLILRLKKLIFCY